MSVDIREGRQYKSVITNHVGRPEADREEREFAYVSSFWWQYNIKFKQFMFR
jgi:hypothetical protein